MAVININSYPGVAACLIPVRPHYQPMSTMGASPIFTASCLCSGIKYEISAEIGPIDVCYCQMCRKAQGGPLATNAPVAASAFRVSQGAELLTEYESSPGEYRLFCRRCGSPIYSMRKDRPYVVRIRVGTVNEPLNVRPAANQYVASKCNWWEIHDNLPRYATE